MAKIGRPGSVQRVSPLKPSLRGARNWATAQMRAASYSKQGFWRLVLSFIAAALFVLVMGLWLGGMLPNAKQAGQDFTRNRLVSMGFVVERIDVMGEGRLNEADVRKALGVNPGDFLFELDVKDAQERVQSLSWVHKAMVRRLWPNRIVVQIIERQPYALWQNGGALHLVDRSGEVIWDADPLKFPHLRLVVGVDAAQHMDEVEAFVAHSPGLMGDAHAFVRTASGRWDIHLEGNVTRIRLPEKGAFEAIERLHAMQKSHAILQRDLAVIDLRLADRLTLKRRDNKPA